MKYIPILVGLLYSCSIFTMNHLVIVENESRYVIEVWRVNPFRGCAMEPLRNAEIETENRLIIYKDDFQPFAIYPQVKKSGMDDLIIRSEGKDRIFVQQGFNLLGMTKRLRNHEDCKT